MEKWQKPEFIAQLASEVPGASLLERNGYNQNWKNKMSSSVMDGENIGDGVQSVSEWGRDICSHGCLRGSK